MNRQKVGGVKKRKKKEIQMKEINLEKYLRISKLE